MRTSEAFWDKSADNYDKTEGRFELIHQRSRDWTKQFLSASDLVLDYGCGTGTTACELAGHVREVRAIDISSRMIELSKEKAISVGVKNVAFEQGDIFDDRFADGSFDVVLAFNMLHTVPDPQNVVQRLHELLRAGGIFVSVTPCLAAKMSFAVRLQIQLAGLLGKLGVIPVPIRRLQGSDVDELVIGEHFDLVEAEEMYAGASSYFLAAKKTSTR